MMTVLQVYCSVSRCKFCKSVNIRRRYGLLYSGTVTRGNQLLVFASPCARSLYTVNQKKTWQFIFEYNFG